MSNSEEATLADGAEHVRVTISDSVSEHIDPRITPDQLASEEQLEKSLIEEAKSCMHGEDKHPKSSEKVDVERAESDEGGGEGPLYVSHSTCLRRLWRRRY